MWRYLSAPFFVLKLNKLLRFPFLRKNPPWSWSFSALSGVRFWLPTTRPLLFSEMVCSFSLQVEPNCSKIAYFSDCHVCYHVKVRRKFIITMVAWLSLRRLKWMLDLISSRLVRIPIASPSLGYEMLWLSQRREMLSPRILSEKKDSFVGNSCHVVSLITMCQLHTAFWHLFAMIPFIPLL